MEKDRISKVKLDHNEKTSKVEMGLNLYILSTGDHLKQIWK